MASWWLYRSFLNLSFPFPPLSFYCGLWLISLLNQLLYRFLQDGCWVCNPTMGATLQCGPKTSLVQNFLKALKVWSSWALKFAKESMAQMSNLKLLRVYVVPWFIPVGRTFQCFVKAFMGPYCGPMGELPQNTFQAWLPLTFPRGQHISHTARALNSIPQILHAPYLPQCHRVRYS